MPRKRTPEQVIAARLRRAVLEHVATERRRRYVPILHVGVPREPHEIFAVLADEPTDHALRADIVAAMRKRAGDATGLVWLTRSGSLELQDVDVEWHAAARQAYGEAAAPLHFAVVNRRGWHHLGTGARREWARPGRSS